MSLNEGLRVPAKVWIVCPPKPLIQGEYTRQLGA